MSQIGHTPDERFLIMLFKLANEKGDPFSMISIAKVSKGISQKETAVKNIIKLLAQANFIKKMGDATVVLTKQGYDFVMRELS